MDGTELNAPSRIEQSARWLALPVAVGLLWWLSLANFLAFHTLVELATISVAALIALAGWELRARSKHNYLFSLAVLYGCIALIDFAHTVTYEGSLFAGDLGPNPPTQLWILARLIEAAGLAVIFNFQTRGVLASRYAIGLTMATAAGLLAIYPAQLFPDAFIPGQGLTDFKITAEFVVIALTALAGYGLFRYRARFKPVQVSSLTYALFFTALAELCFTQYASVYGPANALGHLFRLSSYFFLYRGLICDNDVDQQRSLERINPRAALIALLLCIGGIAIAAGIRNHEHGMQKQAEAYTNTRHLQDIASSLEIAMESRLRLTDSLKAFVLANPYFSKAEFHTFTDTLSQGMPGIISLQLAPEGIVTYVSNENRNAKAIGHNLLKDSRRREAVRQAIDSDQVIVEGPVTLIQGGRALIARQPIFTRYSQETTRFWGLATVLIDVDALLNSTMLNEFAQHFDVALRGLDGRGIEGAVFSGQPAIFEDNPLKAVISLRNGAWQLAAKQHPHAHESQFILSSWYWPSILLLSVLVVIGSYRVVNHRYALVNAVDTATYQLQQEVVRRRQAESDQRHQATHDALTGLANRRLFIELAERALLQAKRDNIEMSVYFMDLDGFKQVNDNLGHAAGDQLLRSVSYRLQETLRQSDILARVGGDEFIALLSSAGAQELRSAETIIEVISEPVMTRSGPVQVGISIGVSVFPHHGDTVDQLLAAADQAMYRAKRKGKNRLEVADSSLLPDRTTAK
ncbi:sensor domain-containing diguanylate cyclase [Motiliproteus sediminis]|uniref:sensor domain-containing diguanylate cyclase n=1 Tax=Motiliproteus sediminis TaxID=1468178 RepID=UPI001AEF5081|nr:MASE3 domain-containing protein [Motiliproteus sediminis]